MLDQGEKSARNDVLRDAALAYLELVRAEHGVAIAQAALANTEKLTELTRQYSETGQGLQSDHQRMEAELAIRREQLAAQQEVLQVASARLAQVLHADPSVLIVSGEPVVTPLDVMVAEDSAAAHVALGLSRRPELSEQKHLVCEAVESRKVRAADSQCAAWYELRRDGRWSWEFDCEQQSTLGC